MNLGAIHQQESKGNVSHLPKRAMGLGKLAQPSMRRRMAHQLPLNPLHFTRRPAKRNMHGQPNRRLHGFFQKVIMSGDRKGFDQRQKSFSRFLVHQLGKAKGNRSQRTFQLPGLALVPIAPIPLRIFLHPMRYHFFLNRPHQSGQDGFVDLRGSFFQPVNQTVDRQPFFWYRKNQAQIQRDLAQRISPFFGCGTYKLGEIRFLFKQISAQKLKQND
jgi:hypothetical protein